MTWMRTNRRPAVAAGITVFVASAVALLTWRSAAADPGAAAAALPDRIDFSRDVRPILAQHCWSCHGTDETTREANLRLDLRDAALAPRDEGKRAIEPGKPDSSLVWSRITTADPDEVMPPPSTKKPLNDTQRAILRRWIEQGAEFSRHWAFTPPTRPTIPAIQQRAAARGPLDALLLRDLERRGITPASDAATATLLRRSALDVTGLPPAWEWLSEALADSGPDAYERSLDRLLASPRYAERMAQQWLDAARYADTNGYNNDEERSMWPWRDWVISAFRRQLPFDQFVIEQLAGDQLPQPTLDQKIATAFHRNHALTTEGGIIEEEYRVEYVADRVHTTASVFLGLSLQCARCHDHKYDPFTQREYYQLFAFFNQLPHHPANYARGGVAEPSLKVPTLDQQRQLRQLDERQREVEVALRSREQKVDELVAAWEAKLTPDERLRLGPSDLQVHLPLDETAGDKVSDLAATPARTLTVQGRVALAEGKLGKALEFDGSTFIDGQSLGTFEADAPFTLAAWLRFTGKGAVAVLSKMDDAQAFRGYDITLEDGRIATHLIDHWPDNAIKVGTQQPVLTGGWHHIAVTYDGSRRAAGVHIYLDGRDQSVTAHNDQLRGSIVTAKPLRIGRRQESIPFHGQLDEVRLYARQLSLDDVKLLAEGMAPPQTGSVLTVAAAERTDAQRERLRRHYLDQIDPEYRQAKSALADLPKQRTELDKLIPAVMIMQDQEPRRETQILRRGQYDQPGDTVAAAVPGVFPALPPEAPANRLGLARWLVDPRHPLTARVAVNRWWEAYFGLGLVETLEDFGVTGASPSYPELLDWLATRLIDSGWDTLALQRTILTSSAYRRSAHVTRDELARDPKNQWLARGPRFRLSAETVRDNALAISGLLVERAGGPSVKPYQPDGLWEDVTVERRHKYQADSGAGLYRRSMYTFWKRTCPPPTMSMFDAPTRETCTIRRARTNTPLQALVLLNDPTYVEAARQFAQQLLTDGSLTTDDQRFDAALRRAVSRGVTPEEQTVLRRILATARTTYQQAPDRSQQLLKVGSSPVDARLAPAELAAWTVVCDTLLNLDETITKP